jgi:hypothetical protein
VSKDLKFFGELISSFISKLEENALLLQLANYVVVDTKKSPHPWHKQLSKVGV